ncbi:MAG: hypothetical protein EOO89_12325 [Pedobacter sp.]|nr:MAG: hypothetical protein EOO89_12325 [Pedobacter sp.]
MSNLNNEPGWAKQPPAYAVSRLDSTAFDLSFLRGKKDVVFRFKYKSNLEVWGGGTVQGLRLDNFRIDGFESDIDYVANDSMVLVNSTASQPTINISYSITNHGFENGRPTSTKFYWSTDSIFDAGDTLIHSVTENPILTGATLNGTTTINCPAPLNQTDYYLFYFADGDSAITETNELNNAGSFQISFQPFTNYFANVQWMLINAQSTQAAFNINYSIINNGLVDGTPTITNFYWSTDSILDAGDQNIYSINQFPVLSGDTLSALASITYPTPLIQPKYYIFYKTDAGNSIQESDENDNVGSYIIEFQLQPNYYADYAGDTVRTFVTQPDLSVEYSIINNGEAPGVNSATAFYWSTNNVLDAGDQVIRIFNESPILPGDTLRTTVSLTYPTPVTQGVYYLFYKADYYNDLPEVNENDNAGFFIIQFQPQPNYYASVAGDTIRAVSTQSVISAPYSIVNNGAAEGSNSITAFYWSADNVFDNGDQLIYSANEAPVPSGDTLFSTVNLIYPTPVNQPGYFLFYKADNGDVVAESNEMDNTGVFEVIFSPSTVPDSSGFINMYVFSGRLYVVIPPSINGAGHVLKMLDITGNVIFSVNTNLGPGANTFLLPPVSGGVYVVTLYNSNGVLVKSILVRI